MIDLVCNVGYFGINCDVKCYYFLFGKECKLICNCKEIYCDYVEGCKILIGINFLNVCDGYVFCFCCCCEKIL